MYQTTTLQSRDMQLDMDWIHHELDWVRIFGELY